MAWPGCFEKRRPRRWAIISRFYYGGRAWRAGTESEPGLVERTPAFPERTRGMGRPVYVSRMHIARPADLVPTPVTSTVANGRSAAGLALSLWVICLAASSSLPA